MELNKFRQRFHHPRRVEPEKDFPLRVAGKPAAVLVPIVKRHNLSVLFTVRARHLNNHAGQISFPGGRWDETDAHLTETALRESEEEIGLSRDKVEIIGSLQSFRTVSRYEVTPFIGLVDAELELQINRGEVEEVFEVPLGFLMNKENHKVHLMKKPDYEYPIYFIPWQDKMIWGATAAFIRSLSNYLSE
jgi:8-oxo-dGTP pyrophosphatase MutT (NUDIX family)